MLVEAELSELFAEPPRLDRCRRGRRVEPSPSLLLRLDVLFDLLVVVCSFLSPVVFALVERRRPELLPELRPDARRERLPDDDDPLLRDELREPRPFRLRVPRSVSRAVTASSVIGAIADSVGVSSGPTPKRFFIHRINPPDSSSLVGSDGVQLSSLLAATILPFGLGLRSSSEGSIGANSKSSPSRSASCSRSKASRSAMAL